jgi:hypothetical protein
VSESQNFPVATIGKSPRDAAVYLRNTYGPAAPSEQTLARYRYDHGRGRPNFGPRFHRMGPKSVFYLQADLDAWATGSPDQIIRKGSDIAPATPKNGLESETKREHRTRRAGRPKVREASRGPP